MKSTSPHIEHLPRAVEQLPAHTRRAMLDALRCSVTSLITGAYAARDLGICPLLAAHRRGGRGGAEDSTFAESWDRFTGAVGAPRGISSGERRALEMVLEASLDADARATEDTARRARRGAADVAREREDEWIGLVRRSMDLHERAARVRAERERRAEHARAVAQAAELEAQRWRERVAAARARRRVQELEAIARAHVAVAQGDRVQPWRTDGDGAPTAPAGFISLWTAGTGARFPAPATLAQAVRTNVDDRARPAAPDAALEPALN